MRLTELGIPKLWREDPEVLWDPLRWGVAIAILGYLAPGSRGYGLDRVPLTGGFVLAANHLAAVDHTVTGIFPVRRGEADRDALREARRLVREGHVVGVHVEGTRQRFGYPGEVKIGGMMIAMQEGVPVIPCGVETFRWSPRNRRGCAVVWGEPISLEGLRRNRAGYEEALEMVRAEIVRLWRQAAEAVATGFPPELSDGTKR